MDKTTDLTPRRAAPHPHPGVGMTPDPSANKRIEEIRAQIEKARQEATRTINELERRLSPAHFITLVRAKTRQATAGRMDAMTKDIYETSKGWGTALYDTIRSNPIPTILVGGGLAWLIASGMQKEESVSEKGFTERRKIIGTDETGTYGLGFIDRRGAGAAGSGGRAQEKAAQKADQAKDRIRSKAAEASGKAAQWSSHVKARASQTGEQLRLKSQEWGGSALEYRRRVQEGIARGGKSFARSVENNPLAMAGVVMAAGVVLGLIIPGTYRAEEKFGPRLIEVPALAREAGSEKMEQIGVVAKESFESAKQDTER
jgi:hypothetical protein